MLNQKCILVSAMKLDFKDGDGKEIKGLSVKFVMSDNLLPTEKNKDFRGYRVAKSFLDIDKVLKVQSVPAIYEMSFDMDVDSSGKQVLKLQDLNFVSEFEVVA